MLSLPVPPVVIGGLLALALLKPFPLHANPREAAMTPPPALSAEDAGERIARLRSEIAFHDRLYFEEHSPVISDYAYDQLKRDLEVLEAAFPSEAELVPPSKRPGPSPAGTQPSVRHRAPMLSLDKAYREADWRRFHQRVVEATGDPEPLYLIEPKFDGLAVSLCYENGRLVHAATRGDGRSGQDITAALRALDLVPERLSPPSRGAFPLPTWLELRGEVYVPLAEFARLNAEREERGETPFAHPRNLAAGVVQRGNPDEVAEMPLALVIHGLAAAAPDAPLPSSQSALHAELAAWGLPALPVCWTARGEAAWTRIGELGQERHLWPFPTDGVVVKVDARAEQLRMGDARSGPRWALACKFAPARALTTLRSIEVQVGRTGVITPVAVFDPVELGGAVIQRASLHNRATVEALRLHLGDAVWIERAGEIIPQIAELDPSRRPVEAVPYVFPSVCPSCGSELILRGADSLCPARQCPAQRQRQLEHFTARGAVDLRGIGPATITKLLASGRVRQPADLFLLTETDIPALEAADIFGASALIEAIDARREAELWRFLYGLGIPGVGPVTAQRLATRAGSLPRLLELSPEELTAVGGDGAGLSDSTAQAVLTFLAEPANCQLVLDLARVVAPGGASGGAPGPLAGRVFVFTGRLETLTRAEASALVEAAGGRVAGGVSGETDFLVVGNAPGQKWEEARRRQVPILDENGFRRLLAEPEASPRAPEVR